MGGELFLRISLSIIPFVCFNLFNADSLAWFIANHLFKQVLEIGINIIADHLDLFGGFPIAINIVQQ